MVADVTTGEGEVSNRTKKWHELVRVKRSAHTALDAGLQRGLVSGL